jgi:hypothetical protein
MVFTVSKNDHLWRTLYSLPAQCVSSLANNLCMKNRLNPRMFQQHPKALSKMPVDDVALLVRLLRLWRLINSAVRGIDTERDPAEQTSICRQSAQQRRATSIMLTFETTPDSGPTNEGIERIRSIILEQNVFAICLECILVAAVALRFLSKLALIDRKAPSKFSR